MDPREYDGREWTTLMRELTPRQLKNAMRSAVRREGTKVVRIARAALAGSGLNVKGNRADWKKGVRAWNYRRATGFLVTVKARAGKKELGMHTNRYGKKKPVLMWAEEGTRQRKTRKRGYNRGRMRAYGILAKATPDMFREAGQGLTPAVEAVCCAKDYAGGVALAEAVRAALDCKQHEAAGLRMRSCLFVDGDESWEEDAYVQRLVFQVKIS